MSPARNSYATEHSAYSRARGVVAAGTEGLADYWLLLIDDEHTRPCRNSLIRHIMIKITKSNSAGNPPGI